MTGTYRLPALDTQFLRTWSPARFAALGLAVYAVLLFVSPLKYNYANLSLEPTVYAAAVLLAFFGGCRVAKMFDSYKPPASVQPVAMSPDLMINLTLFLGFFGVAARAYDRVVVRGFTVADTMLESRETIAESLSVFSYLGGACFSFGIIAMMLIWLSSSFRRRPFAYALAVLLSLYPMLESLVQGGRSTTIHTLFLLFMFARASNAMPWLVRSPAALLAAGIAVIAAAQLFYEIRTLQGADDQIDLADIFRSTAISQYAQPYDWVVEHLFATNGQGLISAVLKTWTHFTQYLTHSWLVYYDNYLNFEGVYGWGRMHFFMVFRLLSGLTGEDLNYDATLYGSLSGISTTAFSSIYYDFGPAGPLTAFAFGYAGTSVQRKSIMFPERWLPLYVYLCFACLMMLLDNQLMGSLGAFAIWTFSLYVPLHYLVTTLARHGDVPEAASPIVTRASPELRTGI